MELDYQDEEQLLSTPPQSHKEHNTSPRRSPRLFRKEVTRSKKETSSPGKRALSRKEGSQEPQPKEDHTQASSQGKTTPRKEVSEHSRAVISSPARKKTSRKEDGGYSRTVTFSVARKQNSRTEDGGQSRTVTSSPARKQNSRKEDGVQSRAATLSPARKKIPREDRNVVELKQAQRPRSVWFSEKLQKICIQEGKKLDQKKGRSVITF